MTAARREKAGLFINEFSAFGHEQIDHAYAVGFRWCIVKCHSGEGAPDVGHVDEPKLSYLRNTFGNENVGGWGNFEPQNDPLHCAWAANGIISARRFPFYVANIECSFPDRVFLKELRHLQPSLVIWLSCEIENPRDWEAWFKVGAIKQKNRIAQAWLPQCYLNLNPPATPEQAVYWAQRTDVRPAIKHWCPPEYVKPTFSVIGGVVSPERDMRSLRDPNAKQLGLTPGFSVYLAENIQLHQWSAFEEGIAAGGAAL